MGSLADISDIISSINQRSDADDIANRLSSGTLQPLDVPTEWAKLHGSTALPGGLQSAIGGEQSKALAQIGQAVATGDMDPMNAMGQVSRVTGGDPSALIKMRAMMNAFGGGSGGGSTSGGSLNPALLALSGANPLDILKTNSELAKNAAETDASRVSANKNRFDMGLPLRGGPSASSLSTTGIAPIGSEELQASPAGGIPSPPSPDQMGEPPGIQLSGTPPSETVPGLSGKAAQDVAVKQAEEKNAEILAAEKGVHQILSRMPSMKAKLKQMNDLAPNTLSGMGVVPPQDSNETYGLKGQLMEQFPETLDSDDKIGATSTFKNLNDQLFVNEIPALMNGASGMRMDIPLVKGVKSASGVPTEIPGKDKQQVIKTLNENFDQTRENALSYYKNLTGHDYDLGKAFQNPQAIKQAYQAGVINKEQATKLLRQNHEFQ